MMRVADGEWGVLAAVREQLRQGASQIKLMGVGTYVATHVYKVAGIERAFDAGMKSIEHGHLADEPTIAMLAERDVWLSTQTVRRTRPHRLQLRERRKEPGSATRAARNKAMEAFCGRLSGPRTPAVPPTRTAIETRLCRS